METSSDDWFSDFNQDGIADLATGRLPALTAEELSSMVSKIIGYEQSNPAVEVLLVADANDGFNLKQASSDLISLIPPA
ncbi:MAG: C25 family cysteine peptidase [Acidobacteriota bacterium]